MPLRPQLTSSGKKISISRAAEFGESEPCTRLKVISSAKSPRIEPGRGLERVGRADHLARRLDRALALEHHRHQRAAR